MAEQQATPESLITDPFLQAQLAAIQKRILEQKQQGLAQAQGESIARGLQGSTYEAARMGLTEKAASGSLSDAAVNLALQQAEQDRQNKNILAEREFVGGQNKLSREQQMNILGKQLAFNAEQNALDRTARRKQAKMDLYSSVFGSVAGATGGYLGSKKKKG